MEIRLMMTAWSKIGLDLEMLKWLDEVFSLPDSLYGMAHGRLCMQNSASADNEELNHAERTGSVLLVLANTKRESNA